ncbi:MAG: DUF488 family protein [Bacteroidota bacterium]
MIRAKRVYEPWEAADGYRLLIDRLWPRGISREQARIDRWMREVAPSTNLRKWFSHDPEKWPEFQQRFRQELSEHPEVLQEIRELAELHGTLTLVFSSRETRYNNAQALLLMLAEG